MLPYLPNICRNHNQTIEIFSAEDIKAETTSKRLESCKKLMKPIMIHTDDNIDRYADNIKLVMADYDRFVVICPAQHPDPRFFMSLDILVQIKTNTKIDKIEHKHDKKYDFLFLPGKDQIWRLDLIKKLLDDHLLDNSLWSFYRDHEDWFPKIKKLLPAQYEFEKFRGRRYDDHILLTNQQIIPEQYSDTFFSIITETGFDTCHFTEKTWKPILAEHPFVIQSGKGHLEILHELGFKTFDNFIDESYENDNEKIRNVCKTITKLDKKEFYAATRDIRSHNLKLCLDDDLVKNFHNRQLALIKKALKI